MVLLFIGTTEIIVIGAIALLIFGGKKLPELMRGLGKGVKEFKEGMNEMKQEAAGENPAEQSPQEDTPQPEQSPKQVEPSGNE